jgi:CHAD domain-containing protein
VASALEHEVKLGAGSEFRLPDLTGVVEGATVVALPERRLEAVYYDTSDLRLARWGVSVHFRWDDGAEERGRWTVKLPDDGDGDADDVALRRQEATFSLPRHPVPGEVSSLVRAYVRSAQLGPVAHLSTRRRRLELQDASGNRLGEVADDEVSVRQGDHVAAGFRDVEVETDERTPPSLLDAVVGRLREAGAEPPDPTPKVARALGPPAAAPPEVVPVDVDDDASAATLVRAALAADLTKLLVHDPRLRRTGDPEDLRKARVAMRRLRSDLRSFGPLLRPEAKELRGELGWIRRQLGAVRDADVLEARLLRQGKGLPEQDQPGLGTLLERLAAERDRARAELHRALGSDRYAVVLDALVAAADAPPCLPEADVPAGEVVPGLVRRRWERLREAVDDLGDDPSPAELHEVRTKAKRCRYAAQAVRPVVGKPAKRLAKRLGRLQDVLGDLQDAVVTEAWLRAAAEDRGGTTALVAGQLVAAQREVLRQCRQEWRHAWERAAKTKHTAWLSDD